MTPTPRGSFDDGHYDVYADYYRELKLPAHFDLGRLSYYDIKGDNALRPDPDNPLNSIQSSTTKSQGFEFQADHIIATRSDRC